jgi:hypothetical protein
VWSVVTKECGLLLDKVPKIEQDELLYCCCAKEQDKNKTKDGRFRRADDRLLIIAFVRENEHLNC